MDGIKNYSSNSFASQTEKKQEPKIEIKPLDVNVSIKKKSWLSRMAGKFLSDDAKTVGTSYTSDMLIPKVKNFIFETVKYVLEVSMFGRTSAPRNTSGFNGINYWTGSQRVQTQSFFSQPQPQNMVAGTSNSLSQISDIVFPDRVSALSVIDQMSQIAERYGNVSVATFYDIIRRPELSKHTDNGYGWDDLSLAYVKNSGNGGYNIIFPKLTPIK